MKIMKDLVPFFHYIQVFFLNVLCMLHMHAGHTRKASRISKRVVENCGKGVGNFYLS